MTVFLSRRASLSSGSEIIDEASGAGAASTEDMSGRFFSLNALVVLRLVLFDFLASMSLTCIESSRSVWRDATGWAADKERCRTWKGPALI